MKKKSKNIINLIAIVLFTFIAFWYTPYEMFLENVADISAPLAAFWWIPIALFLLSTLILVLVCVIKPNIFGNILTYVVFAGGIALWIQGNFLNINAGSMNGETIDWKPYYSQMKINLAIWCGILVVVLILAFGLKEKFDTLMVIISSFLTAILFVTLITLLFTTDKYELINSKNTTFISTEGLYELGSDENVVVFVLDMFDDVVFEEFIEEDSDILNKLDGFTYYSNLTGTYSTTLYSMTSILSGKIFKNEAPRVDWMNSQAENRLYIDELTDNGYELSIYTIVANAIPQRIYDEQTNLSNEKIVITDKTEFMLQLYRLAACKYLPDAFKMFIWMDGTELFGLTNIYLGSNIEFRKGLETDGISVADNTKEFKIIHLDGPHPPNTIGPDGENKYFPYSFPGSFRETAHGCMYLVECYLEQMKELGIYDNTAVIITADHGVYEAGVISNPIMMIKPMNSRGDFAVDDTPAAQICLGATIVDLIGDKDYEDYGISLLNLPNDGIEDRYFYQYYLDEGFYNASNTRSKYTDGNARLIEYKAGDSDSSFEYELTGKEYTVEGEVIDHQKYCISCQENREYSINEFMGGRVLVHQPTEDNPSWNYINQSMYDK